MAARLTDEQKKKIIADYAVLRSYNATANANGVAPNTVKNVVKGNAEIAQLCTQKNAQNTADILDYMDRHKDKVCDIIGLYLDELMKVEQFEKLTPSQLSTVIGTLIDKWTTANIQGNQTEDKVTVVIDV